MSSHAHYILNFIISESTGLSQSFELAGTVRVDG